MLRKQLIQKQVGAGAFRWRGLEISRIEGLSDAVFGFSITFVGGFARGTQDFQ